MRTTAAEKWDRKGVLKRLMRIAEEARAATSVEKIGKDGEPTLEYDTKCASIELKAIEYAVKLTGLLEEDKKEEITVTLDSDAEPFAL